MYMYTIFKMFQNFPDGQEQDTYGSCNLNLEYPNDKKTHFCGNIIST